MKLTVKVGGLMCGHCSARLKKALEATAGITSAEVDHTAGTATVDGDVTLSTVKAVVEDTGFEFIG